MEILGFLNLLTMNNLDVKILEVKLFLKITTVRLSYVSDALHRAVDVKGSNNYKK